MCYLLRHLRQSLLRDPYNVQRGDSLVSSTVLLRKEPTPYREHLLIAEIV